MSPPSEISPTATAHVSGQPEYNPQERLLLLQLAHDAILSTLEGRELTSTVISEHLSESRGAFTTLFARGKLRGCVGYPSALLPVYRTVIETARSAAFDDPRFTPVTQGEAPELLVSISVLSPLQPISPEAIEVGRHGLLVSDGARRGLLLPQVPVEHGWDRITFLEQTCGKASLPLDAWRSPQVKIEAFTAEVFADPGCEG